MMGRINRMRVCRVEVKWRNVVNALCLPVVVSLYVGSQLDEMVLLVVRVPSDVMSFQDRTY